MEHLHPAPRGSRVDELADVHVTRGNHAVERRIYPQAIGSSSSRCMLASADSTAELVDACWVTNVSVSCLETAFFWQSRIALALSSLSWRWPSLWPDPREPVTVADPLQAS